jgi:hypothetical protein
VPCLLILKDGTVEKYDGEKVFLWVNQVMDNFKKSQEPSPSQDQVQAQIQAQVQSQIQAQVQSQVQAQIQAQMGVAKNIKYDEVEVDSDVEENVEKKYVPQSLMKVPKTKSKKVGKINMTRIEDLDEKEEEEETDPEQEVKIKRPPIPIRNGSGNYSFENELEDEPSTSKYVTKKKLKKTGDDKGGSILDAAMAMRQEREKENKE